MLEKVQYITSIIAAILIPIIIIVTIIQMFTKNVKIIKGRNDILKDNKFLKENKDKLDEIVEHSTYLAGKTIFELILTTVLFVLAVIFVNKNFGFTHIGIYVVIVILFFIASSLIEGNYDFKFKERIVAQIIKIYNPTFKYSPHAGFTKEEYSACKFIETCDSFKSEDLITDEKTQFKFATVKSENVHHSDERTHKEATYAGALACIPIRDIDCRVFLGNTNTSFENLKKIEFENETFNKIFTAYTDNELEAYKLLTPEVMEKFVLLHEDLPFDMEVRYLDNILYIRLSSGAGIMPSLFNPASEKRSIYVYVAVLEEAINTIYSIKEIIEKKNS